MHDGEQPGPHIRVVPPRVQLVQGPHQTVMHQIVRVVPMAEQCPRVTAQCGDALLDPLYVAGRTHPDVFPQRPDAAVRIMRWKSAVGRLSRCRMGLFLPVRQTWHDWVYSTRISHCRRRSVGHGSWPISELIPERYRPAHGTARDGHFHQQIAIRSARQGRAGGQGRFGRVVLRPGLRLRRDPAFTPLAASSDRPS